MKHWDFVHKNGPKPPTPLWQIAQYLSERGFGVIWYDKRGVGAHYTILDTKVWENATANYLIQDSKKALNVLMQQPEVYPRRISIIGHSEGTIYAPRVAIDNSTNVKNIILMGTRAQNPCKVLYYNQVVSSPSEYAIQVLDKNHTGLISIQQLGIGPIQQYVPADLYAWLEAHSGLSHSYATITTTSHMRIHLVQIQLLTPPPAVTEDFRCFLALFV
jgi:Serine aminopeptidase, S33